MRTPPRILVVDDNPTNVKILQTRLASAGYDIVTAADGEEALATARESAPDLILLDVMMPRLDGIEVCRRLRADPQFPFTPIVLVTALSETKDMVAGLDAGGDETVGEGVGAGFQLVEGEAAAVADERRLAAVPARRKRQDLAQRLNHGRFSLIVPCRRSCFFGGW